MKYMQSLFFALNFCYFQGFFMFLVFLLYVLLAGSFIVAKYAVSVANPLFLIGFRMTVAGAIWLAYYYWSRRRVQVAEPVLSWRESVQLTAFHVYFRGSRFVQ
jgi:drug/metabolite transporter (DMT)-like permease